MFSKQLSYIIIYYHILSYIIISLSTFSKRFKFRFYSESSSCWDWLQPPNWGYATPLGGDSWTDLSNGYGEGMTDHDMVISISSKLNIPWDAAYGRTSISFEQPISGILWHLGRITLLILVIYNKIIVIHLFRTGLTASRSDAGGIACQPFLSHLRKELAAEAPGPTAKKFSSGTPSCWVLMISHAPS